MQGRVVAVCVALASGPVGAIAAPSGRLELASVNALLPVQFFGEAAAVGLAFALPAILAATWLGLTSLKRSMGLAPLLIATGILGIGIGAAVFELQGGGLTRLAGG